MKKQCNRSTYVIEQQGGQTSSSEQPTKTATTIRKATRTALVVLLLLIMALVIVSAAVFREWIPIPLRARRLLTLMPPTTSGAAVTTETTTNTRVSATTTIPKGSTCTKDTGPASAVPLSEQQRTSSEHVGVLVPPHFANISSRFEGRITSVSVRIGQRVKKGDTLVSFDAREHAQALVVANASLKAAQGAAAAASADATAAKMRATRRGGASVTVGGRQIPLVSGEEAQQAAFDSRGASGRAATASASVEEQRARIAQLKLALEEAEIRAPFDGIVTGVYTQPGVIARAAETLVRVVGHEGNLRLRFAIAAAKTTNIEAIDKNVRVVLDDGKVFSATIDRLSPEVEPAALSVIAEGAIATEELTSDAVLMLAGRTVTVRTTTIPKTYE